MYKPRKKYAVIKFSKAIYDRIVNQHIPEPETKLTKQRNLNTILSLISFANYFQNTIEGKKAKATIRKDQLDWNKYKRGTSMHNINQILAGFDDLRHYNYNTAILQKYNRKSLLSAFECFLKPERLVDDYTKKIIQENSPSPSPRISPERNKLYKKYPYGTPPELNISADTLFIDDTIPIPNIIKWNANDSGFRFIPKDIYHIIASILKENGGGQLQPWHIQSAVWLSYRVRHKFSLDLETMLEQVPSIKAMFDRETKNGHRKRFTDKILAFTDKFVEKVAPYFSIETNNEEYVVSTPLCKNWGVIKQTIRSLPGNKGMKVKNLGRKNDPQTRMNTSSENSLAYYAIRN